MKILFIVANLKEIGGIQRYNKVFYQTLIDLRENVKLVELKRSKLIFKLRFIVNSVFTALRFKPDIIICSHINFSPICYFLKKLFGFEYTVTIYGIEAADIRNRLHYNSLKSAKFIINLFEQTADNVVRQIPELKNKIILLPNSIDGDNFFIKDKSSNLINRYNLSGFKIIVTVSRLSKSDRDNKCYDRVIKAMPLVLKNVKNVKYLLVGNGDDLVEMKKLAEELNLGSRVIFTGSPNNDEMIDYYNLADVFVFPSQREGFPAIVPLEALACGKPIIGGEQPGSEKKLFKKDFGIIVNSNDINAIAAAIVNILTGKASKHFYDPEFLRRKVLENYGLESYRTHIKNLIDKINHY